ncbi:YeiH family protein [Alkalihalobacillus pseudalcaliphilus]|uniref:YeiH family protein n=1 Tax=Alkalihalobacillus pseudalcaliphilus TaxID=79884 RepID=UPI00064DB587|nr:putative sulfate exporter family transporter [Alkalihalobacillus pseudalcaliphilus]KMK75198.1 membrane protein [Alkalihalobacillus pseudalcaliphilus]
MNQISHNKNQSYALGITLTLVIAFAAQILIKLPYLHMVGPLILAIILGISFNTIYSVPSRFHKGIEFSSKKLLRAGIILLGLRLHLGDIQAAGLSTFIYAFILVLTTLISVYSLARLFKVHQTLSLLTACGTAICGAAAIIAIAPLVKAKDQMTAVSITVIALLGTLLTLLFTLLYPLFPLTDYQYGLLVGGTLHEIAHAIAASTVGGVVAEDIALIVKLTRVILLVPVAVCIGVLFNYFNKKDEEGPSTSAGMASFLPSSTSPMKPKMKWPIPWFIFGFLAMSTVNTFGLLSETLTETLISLSYLFLAMAMAGVGLKVKLNAFKDIGPNILYAGLIGTVLLVGLGYLLLSFM